jgi:hypothetical protein
MHREGVDRMHRRDHHARFFVVRALAKKSSRATMRITRATTHPHLP